MPISTLWRLDKIVFPSSVEIRRIENQAWNAGVEQLLQRSGGELHPDFVGTLVVRPEITFSTPQLATLLAPVGLGGSAVTSAIDTYLKRVAEVGNFARASTVHKRLRVSSSVVYIRSIRLPHNGAGSADVAIVAAYDGVNAPIVYAGSVALSGSQAAVDELFGAGPCALNGVAIPDVQEITIDTGVTIGRRGSGSELYDTAIFCEQKEITVTVKCHGEVNWSTIGLTGLALDGANGLRFFARRFADKATRVADGSASHILFQGLVGQVVPQNTSGSGSDLTSDTFAVKLAQTSESSTPLAVTLNSAIT